MSKKKEETEKLKIKKPSLKRKNDEVYKVKLDEKQADAIPIGETREVPSVEETGSTRSTKPTHSKEGEDKEVNPIKEITEKTEEVLETATAETPQTSSKVPENLDKLVTFMNETGGTLDDYVRLNADYSNVNEDVLLREYYFKTKPHLTEEEVIFTLGDKFSYDEEIDEERDVKKKQLAMKEEVAKAKNFLESLKEEYYQEIKLRPGVTQEQQKAMEFFNRYNKEQEIAQQQHLDFKSRTDEYFNSNFEGFDFNVGDKRFKYGVNNPEKVAESQSNLNTFIKKFLDTEGNVNDHKGYHKAIYAARNIDTIAEHFYEQGKADAVKDITARSNNVDTSPRPSPSGQVTLNGWTVKAISGVDSSKLKIKTKKHN